MDALRVLILQKGGAVSSGAWSSCEVSKDPGHPEPLVSKPSCGGGPWWAGAGHTPGFAIVERPSSLPHMQGPSGGCLEPKTRTQDEESRPGDQSPRGAGLRGLGAGLAPPSTLLEWLTLTLGP